MNSLRPWWYGIAFSVKLKRRDAAPLLKRVGFLERAATICLVFAMFHSPTRQTFRLVGLRTFKEKKGRTSYKL